MNFETFLQKIKGTEYEHLIETVRRENRGLNPEKSYQIHHIHPKGLGGEFCSKNNLIKLSLYEHCKAHTLLAKIYPVQATFRPYELFSIQNAV